MKDFGDNSTMLSGDVIEQGKDFQEGFRKGLIQAKIMFGNWLWMYQNNRAQIDPETLDFMVNTILVENIKELE